MGERAKVIEFPDKKSPQKENGYTAVANELMDALAKYPLPGAQMQCLIFILRKTYGFNKKSDLISLSQFAKRTGIPRRNVARAIDQLKKKNIIKVKKCGVKYDTTTPSKYSLNKDYSTWKDGVKIDTGSVKSEQKVVSNMTHTKDNITKEINIADSAESAKNQDEDSYLTKSGKKLTGKRLDTFNQFWEAFNFKKGKAAAADSWIKIPVLNNSIVAQILSAAKIEASNRADLINNGQTPKWAQGWLTERRWEDEAYYAEPKQKISVFKVEDDD